MDTSIPIAVDGHVLIKDTDTGEILLDKCNAVHPQNIARCIARAFSNENNFIIHRVALGNGGTTQDAIFQINYRVPNDGQNPGSEAWKSRLYSETYTEIIDDSNPNIKTGPGASPSGDPAHVEHVSGPGVRSIELGLTSQIVIEMVLNKDEPTSQPASDNLSPQGDPEDDFVFDELGLFTTGRPDVSNAGYQFVDIGNKISTDDTGLMVGDVSTLTFDVVVDGTSETIAITPNTDFPGGGSGTSNEILYSDLITVLNGKLSISTASITVPDVTPGLGGGVQTYGYLQLASNTVGDASSMLVDISAFTSSSGFKIADFNGLIVGGDASGLDGVVNGGANVEASFVIDNGVPINVSISQASAATFTTLVAELNTALGGVAVVDITTNAGNMTIISTTTGDNSTVAITDTSLFSNLTNFNVLSSSVNGSYTYPASFLFPKLTGFVGLQNPIAGQNSGIQNDAVLSSLERERLLTHIIFSPVRKAANRAFTIIYTLTVAVARSPGQI